jgi:hypothetical protein
MVFSQKTTLFHNNWTETKFDIRCPTKLVKFQAGVYLSFIALLYIHYIVNIFSFLKMQRIDIVDPAFKKCREK